MFTTKKKKIQKYLEQKANDNKCAFDILLSDYLDGSLKEDLLSIEIKKADIHIDWHDDIKCIGIQGRYKEYYMDLQIYPNEFSISFDLDEPDDDIIYLLESKEQVYSVIDNMIKSL
ncbi:MAG: hypothetical protein E7601_00805 [Ruminococcaceae bacterium]|nr:hypothetical protein [Oscillospiraceae bacterium]